MGSVYKAIAAVQADMAVDGIGKNRTNSQQGYKFRGIDDVYNALAPSLAKHGLCILPRVLDRTVTERESKHGGALFYVVVAVEFDFVAAEDGSAHTVRTYGEAMDSADKATNKAMSAAYKYACMQAFCIPTDGDNDADATTHEVAANRGEQAHAPRQSRGFVAKFDSKTECPKCGHKPRKDQQVEFVPGTKQVQHINCPALPNHREPAPSVTEPNIQF